MIEIQWFEFIDNGLSQGCLIVHQTCHDANRFSPTKQPIDRGGKRASAICRRLPTGGHRLVGFGVMLDDRSQSGLETVLELPC